MDLKASQQFKEYFAKWVVAPNSLSISYLARNINSKWVLWNCRLIFGPKTWDKEDQWEVKTENVLAGTINLNLLTLEAAHEVLTSAIQGKIAIGSASLELSEDSEFSYYSATTENSPTYFSHILKVTPKNGDFIGLNHNDFLAIEEELRCSSPPFDGLPDLLPFLGFSDNSFYVHPYIEAVIQPPIDMDLSACTLDQGRLNIRLIKHPHLDPASVSVGLRLFPQPTIGRRFKIKANEISWIEQGGFETGTFSKNFPDCVMVQILLSANGKSVRRFLAQDANRAINVKFQSYRFFDNELKKLKESLETEKNGKGFEKAITTIFHILGFSVSNPMETDAPDIVLYTPKGKVILVECTTLTHDIRTKAGKLHHRKEELQENLRDDFPWISVIPVLVCNLEKNKITEDEFLKNNNIILYCKEEIRSALDSLALATDPDSLIDMELERISQSSKDQLFGIHQ